MGDWEGLEPRLTGFENQGSVTDPCHLQDPQLPPINTSAQPAAAAAAAAAGSNGGSNGDAAMRLGLKLEQRGDVRRLVDVLARRVRQAGDDLAAAVAEVRGGDWLGLHLGGVRLLPGTRCQHGLLYARLLLRSQ
jgi:hypothetical protein